MCGVCSKSFKHDSNLQERGSYDSKVLPVCLPNLKSQSSLLMYKDVTPANHHPF
jgi:hypothetical protein